MSEQLTITLDVQRPCNYILLKPTNFRRFPYDNTNHFNKNPLEIKYFATSGYEVNESINNDEYTTETTFKDILQQLEIHSVINGKKQKLDIQNCYTV